MKRLGSTDSLGALMSVCPSAEEYNGGKGHVYSREFQSMLEGIDEEGCVEECGQKKRRLSVDQVKALEKNFEVENKLEPERKVKLAQELGLQPRQVAVWFQNRRARWKTKQLERDYGVLKASYEALKHNYDRLQQENEALDKEVRELKSKLNGEENNESNASVKEEEVPSQKDDKIMKRVEPPPASDPTNSDDTELNYESFNNEGVMMGGSTFFPDLKDGSSDSDSSAILNDDNNSNSPNYSSGILQSHHQFMPPANCFPFQVTTEKAILGDEKAPYLPQFVKIEEHNFFSGDESCNFFSDDQAPTLQWYCHEQWN